MEKSEYIIIVGLEDGTYAIDKCIDHRGYVETLVFWKVVKSRNISCFQKIEDGYGYKLIYKRINGIESWYGNGD